MCLCWVFLGPLSIIYQEGAEGNSGILSGVLGKGLESSAVEGLGHEASKQENLGYKEISLRSPTSNLMTSFVIENYLLVQARGRVAKSFWQVEPSTSPAPLPPVSSSVWSYFLCGREGPDFLFSS